MSQEPLAVWMLCLPREYLSLTPQFYPYTP
jgi:hypothetical protein